MKVLWLGQQDTILPWLNDLRHYLSMVCDVVVYGDGPEFIHKYDVRQICLDEEPDVIMIGNNQYVFKHIDKVKVPKALKCTDPWANITKHVEFVRTNNVKLILMNYNCATPEYMKYLPRRQFAPFPHTLNTKLFYPTDLPKVHDVMLAGVGNSEYYPLRLSLYNAVPKMTGVKVFTKDRYVSFEEYVKSIGQTKVFAFGNVNHQVGESPVLTFPMAKIYEVMGCKVLCMMDCPDEAAELHLINGFNFVVITESNFRDEILYYLKNNEERERIATNGYNTMLQYHTVEIRGDQLRIYLETISRR